MRQFTFAKSFSDVMAEEKAACSCGTRESSPGSHLEGCPVASLYREWTAAARAWWGVVQAAPGSPPAQAPVREDAGPA